MNWKHHLGYSGPTDDLDRVAQGDLQADEALATFRKYANHVELRYPALWDKKKDKTRTPYEKSSSYLKRAAYALTRHFLQSGCLEAIGEAARLRAARLRRPSLEENPFHWTFVCILPGDMLKDKAGPSDWLPMFRQDRNRFARKLLYAHAHDVPSEFLVGFLLQAGGTNRVIEKLKAGQREPWFSGGGQVQ